MEARPVRARRPATDVEPGKRGVAATRFIGCGSWSSTAPLRGRRLPLVALGWAPARVGRCFLVGATTNAAVQLRLAGRGFAASVVCDANDLAHAAARAWSHGGTPVGDGRFRACTAPLTQDFGHGRHQRPASDSQISPSTVGTCSPRANVARKEMSSPAKTCANRAFAETSTVRGTLGRSGRTPRRGLRTFRGYASRFVWNPPCPTPVTRNNDAGGDRRRSGPGRRWPPRAPTAPASSR
jgi:hypothetical protein